MNNKKGEIAFASDIIADAAEELNMPYRQVEYHLKFIVYWVRTLTKLSNITSILLPHIGTMYIRWSKLKRDTENMRNLPEERRYKTWESRLKNNEERLLKLQEIYKGKENIYLRQKKKAKITNYYFNCKKTREELETWQNQS